ncbi:Glucose-repressible protein [Varicellaria rhodocarpa]|nr:Glucose-repressible protein [Varicellaria rhodocarpa]
MQTIKDTVNYAKETVQGGTSEASKEANKQVAKDSNASIGTRVNAATDAVGDKFDQHKHNTAAEVHKEAAKH